METIHSIFPYLQIPLKFFPLCNNLPTIFSGTYKSFICCVNNNGGSRNCLWKLTLRLRDRQGRCGPFYRQIRQGSQSKDTATQHTDTHWPLDITIIHSLAILRQKHNTIRWEIPNSQLNLIKRPIYVVTMKSYSLNTIANLPSPCQLILIFTVCNGWDIIIFIYSICACLLFAPASCYCIAWHH